MKALFLLLVLFVAASSQAQIITTVAGNGSTTYSGDGGLALAAGIPVPVGVASDKRGNIYISSYSTHAIRKVDVFGIISVVAGNGTSGYSGDGGPATAAQLNYPGGICFDTSGNLLVADWLNNRVRIIDTLGVIRTYAGTSVGGFAGDGGAATAARLSGPSNIAFNIYGDLLIADHWNSRIRKVSALGNITTVAGNGFAGYTGDGGAATSASINQAIGIAVDNRGNIFIADAPNQVIRKVNCSDTITTYAGNGSYGYSGDGSAATSAQLWSPANVKTDSFGNLFVLDFDNSCIRKIDSFNIISTICGIGGSYGFSGDGGPASAARLSYPQAMDIDECGNYYIADRGNNRIRKITNSVISTTPGASVTIATYSDTVCASTSTTYNATVTGGGAFVSFLWLLNDSIVATSNSSTYTYTPANGDSVKCKVATWNRCSSVSYATSNTIHMVVDSAVHPAITLTGPLVWPPGGTVTITATVTGIAGSYTIYWYLNGALFTATTTPMFSFTKSASYDTVMAILVPSQPCADSAISNTHVISPKNEGWGSNESNVHYNIQLYPNPAGNILYATGLPPQGCTITLCDMLGREWVHTVVTTANTPIPLRDLPPAVYIVRIRDTNTGRSKVQRLLVE